MTTHKHTVQLSKQHLTKLHTITHKGTHNARVILRARVLLMSHDGAGKDAIAIELLIGRSTVQRVRDRYRNDGLDRALHDAPRSGQPRKLDTKAEAHLIALACSDPPDGRARWTLQLLADRMVEDKKVESISDVCVLSYLTARNVKPWVEKNVVHPEGDAGIHHPHGGRTHAVRTAVQSS